MPHDDHAILTHPTPTRGVAVAAVGIFLTLLFLPGLYHLAYGLRPSDLDRWAAWLHTKPPADAVRAIDGDFDRRFLLRFMALSLTANVPTLQSNIRGSEIQVGTGGFLFAEEDTRVCTAAGFLHPHFPRPTQALDQIAAFDRALKSHGMHLLVVPVPAKATLYPDRLDPHYDPARGPFLNVDNARWFAKLRDAGVDALDLTPVLWPHRNDPAPLFYPADTHWTDHGKRLAAAAIADHLRPLLAAAPPAPARAYQTRRLRVTIPENLFDADNPAAERQTYREDVIQLYNNDGVIQPGDDAPLVLIGDSQAGIGTDAGYGLAQRLTQATGVDVQPLAVIGGTPDQMRAVLAERPQSLRPGRTVVWVFSIRHLLIHPWDPIPLPH